MHLQSWGSQCTPGHYKDYTAFYISQAIKLCTHSVVCSITFASANQKVNIHIGLSQKGISYVLVEQLQRWYHRDSLVWLQAIRSENDIQKNCSSGTFQPRRSSSGTKVQEGGSSWSKCPFVPDNDHCSQNVAPLQLICTTAMWITTSLSTLLLHLSTSLSLPMKRWKNAI